MILVEILFWASVVLLGYVYAGYPLALFVLSRFVRDDPVAKGATKHRVSLIISAYNEERVIREKIENSLALEYDRDKLEILVISDASSDRTDEIVGEYADRGVRLHRMPARGGKTLGLNEAVRIATGDLLVFSDANAMYARDAIEKLVRNFADPHIGCVTGDSRYTNPSRSEVGTVENTYWQFERVMKVCESRLGSMVGADGAIFAIRRELYSSLDKEDINDFVIPLQIVERGYRCVFEPEAACYEAPTAYFEEEFRRKTRIVNRSWNGVFRVRQLLNPFRHGWFAFQLLSHKVLRWLTAFALLVVLACSAILFWSDRGWFFGVVLAGQVAGYTVGALGLLLERFQVRPRWLSLPTYFLVINAASLLGVLAGMFGRKVAVWEPQREGESR